jgi:hypothetical protein
MANRAHSIIREGLIAGFLGATGVAVWFLIVDLVAGRPFYTPFILGRGMLALLGPPEGESAFALVALYTVFHYAAFGVVGIVAVMLIHAAERQPAVLAGCFLLFVMFEIGFHGVVALMEEVSSLRGLAWYQIMAGNLVASGLMGGYLWRTHPELREELRHALDGTA